MQGADPAQVEQAKKILEQLKLPNSSESLIANPESLIHIPNRESLIHVPNRESLIPNR
jgi:hypothetical protein